MKKKTHHIQKQVVNFDFETEKNARQWNRRFADFYYDDILPSFNSLLDDTIPDDRSYVIDRIEIDLGVIHMDEFQSVFLKKVEEELKRILKKGATFDPSAKETKGPVPEDSAGQQSLKSKRGDNDKDDSDGKEVEKNLRIKDSKEDILGNLIHFLDHGVLQWNSKFETLEELEAALFQEVGIEEFTDHPDIQRRIRRKSVMQRLYFQFSRTFSEKVFSRFYSVELAVFLSLKEDLEKYLIPLAKDVPSRKKIEQELSKSIWKKIIGTGPVDTGEWPQYFVISIVDATSDCLKSPEKEPSVFKTILESLPPSSPLAAHLEAIIDKNDISKEFKKTEKDQEETDSTQKSREDKQEYGEETSSRDSTDDRVEQSLKKRESGEEISKETLKPDEKKTGQRGENKEESEKGELSDAELSGAPGSEDRSTRPDPESQKKRSPEHVESPLQSKEEQFGDVPESNVKKDRQPDHLKELEEYYLRNAGIILCWPYLSRLFTNLGYLEDQAFKEPRYQQRAVHLLGYIGSGKDQCEEHELVLSKFLCAWPLQIPIIKELELTDEEMDSAEKILDSLISHWSVLKNTSVEGLRESFFQRDGKLFKEDEQWRLIVEQESYDMLLDHLPFSISMIKLPWMEAVLKVDWA